jgi:hypothetical protein
MKTKTITLNVPHRLSQEEARARIAAGVAEVRSRHAGTFARLEERWTGDHMDFLAGLLGQCITGRVDVGAEAVLVEIDLPWVLAVLAKGIRPQLANETRKMLESPAQAAT